MKGSNTRQHDQPNRQPVHNRPENKDNLDSRKNEEWDYKGDDITHNKKETKEEHLKEKNDR